MKNKFLSVLVKVLILIGMAVGVAVAVYATMLTLREFVGVSSINGTPVWLTYASYGLMLMCVAGAEYIAVILFRMMQSLDKDPFVQENVKALRRMGFAALGIMVCGLATLILRPVPLAVIAALPVGVCGLFSLVLSGVFAKAVACKEENDLTV